MCGGWELFRARNVLAWTTREESRLAYTRRAMMMMEIRSAVGQASRTRSTAG
jgi:hypothetical protein